MGKFIGFAEDKLSQISFGLERDSYNKIETIRRKLPVKNRSVLVAALFEYGMKLLLDKDPKIMDYLEIKLGVRDIEDTNFSIPNIHRQGGNFLGNSNGLTISEGKFEGKF